MSELAEGARLEIVCGESHRRFESFPLRHIFKELLFYSNSFFCGLFVVISDSFKNRNSPDIYTKRTTVPQANFLKSRFSYIKKQAGVLPACKIWWAHKDLNLGLAGYEPAALPTELWARSVLMVSVRRKLMYSCMWLSVKVLWTFIFARIALFG